MSGFDFKDNSRLEWNRSPINALYLEILVLTSFKGPVLDDFAHKITIWMTSGVRNQSQLALALIGKINCF